MEEAAEGARGDIQDEERWSRKDISMLWCPFPVLLRSNLFTNFSANPFTGRRLNGMANDECLLAHGAGGAGVGGPQLNELVGLR